MALQTDAQRTFRLYVTNVDGEGPFLRISGQLDKQSACMIESLIDTSRPNFDSGIGAVPPAAILEGIICAAKYKDGVYYRAKIISTTNLSSGLVGVYFIDYGNKDIISLSTIRFLDKYDPLLLQLRGQATDYYLARIMHPTARWEEPLVLKLQSLLCYSEYPATVEAQTRSLPIISIQFQGNDLSQHLVANKYGLALPVPKQEVLLLQLESEGVQPTPINWPSSFSPDANNFTEHVPFFSNQNFPSNPASAMRLQQNMPLQNMSLPFNGVYAPPPSAISQRLMTHKVPRSLVQLKAPRQPQTAQVVTAAPVTPPTPAQAPGTPVKAGSPKKITKTYKSRLLEVNSQHKVYVSYAEEGPELFAVQLVTDAKRLQDMMDEINRQPHRSLTEPPMIGTVCLGRMSGDRIICRAIVMNLSGSQCKLFFVDFGDTEMVSYYDIFDIPEEFVKPNVFAMRFCLSGVKNLAKGPHLNKMFNHLVNGKVLTLRVVSPEGPPLIQYGELYLDNKNVLEMLMTSVKETLETLQFQWMEMLPKGSRHSVLVSYVDSCIKFYVQLSDNIDSLNAVMDAVKSLCESTSSPGELPVGSACCARFPEDGNWYRARIRDFKGGKIIVAYVDYGNEQEVDVSDLRAITRDLIQLPAQAMKCALKGFEDKPVETKTSNQLEMLALEKTLMANVIGVTAGDTMLVSLVDDTVSPPLDVARKMLQLSQPRSHEPKVTTPSRKDAPEAFSSPEGSVPDDSRKKLFRREKSFKDERRPPREGADDFARGGSFRSRETREERPGFDRAASGRNSDKFAGRPDKGDRRPSGKPWENAAPISAANDEWEESPATNTYASQSRQPRDNDTKFNKQDEWEEKKQDTWGSDRPPRDRPERRDNHGDRSWGEKKEYQKRDFNKGERGDRAPRSNFTPRDRAERADRSFGSDGDKKSDRGFKSPDGRPGRAPDFKSRSKFTQVQYKELPNPVPIETPFAEPSIDLNAQHEVSVTWIVSPDSFYTQILSQQSKFLEMMHKIPEIYKGVKPYTGIIPVGASVLARYPEDSVLYRATVVSAQPFGKFIVQYVDFGNKFLIDARDVWQLDQELMELPKMAVHCSLLGVAPKDGEWKADKDVDLCFNAPRYQCVYQELVEDKYLVSLWNNGASVADMLVEKELAVGSQQGSAVTLKDEAIDLTIIVGQQILCRVTHVESHEKFFVQLDLEKAALVESAIANYDAALLTPLAPESLANDVHCTVKQEGKIYRAILSDVSDAANIKVVLPDYGMSITTGLENLMILPDELTVYFYQSLQCCLNNYTEESTKLLSIEELKARLTDKKMIVYINDVDGIILVTTLYDAATGQKVAIFEPDEGAYDEVVPLCARAVFNYNFGLAYVSHVESLNEVYLQKAADGDRIALMLDDLYKFYEEGTPEALSEFETDGLCVAKSSDGNWYRATILTVTDAECKVQFPDYGNTETVPKDSLKKIDPQFYEPCSLAIVTGLGLVALTDDAITKLKEWTEEKEVQVTLNFGSDGWLANLHLDGVDLAMKLVNEKLATPQVATEEEAAEAPAAEPISLPEGCRQAYISHVDTPGQFWLQMSDKIDTIEKIQEELQANAASYADLESREMGVLCAAKYTADELWYRAEILDSDSDITTVRFIDYGNTDVLDNQPGVLKVIPDHLKETERYAVKASVNAVPTGTGQWSEPASDYFTELVGDMANPVDALVVLTDDTTYVDIFVNGQNLTDKLVSEEHATRSEQPECGGEPAFCFVSHVNSPSEFWIQLETATEDLQSMDKAMVGSESLPELTEKEEGVLCAAKYPEDGAWYRAQVIVDGSEGTEVLFMDYGNASIATELRSLPEELKAKPALSRKCALQKPRDIKSWSRKSEAKFNELALNGETVFNVHFIASGDISIVELYLNGKSITEELVDLCEEHPLSERPTPVGQDLKSSGKICYTSSVDEFHVNLDSSASDLGVVMEKMIDSADFAKATDLKVGTVCAAFWAEDEQWYRAKILESCDVGYHVQFIDYGNKAKCEDFRLLPEDLALIEPLAKCCRLATSDESGISEAARKRFDAIAADGSTFLIEFLDTTKEPVLVRLTLDGEDISNVINNVYSDASKEVQPVENDNVVKPQESFEINKVAEAVPEGETVKVNEEELLETENVTNQERLDETDEVLEPPKVETNKIVEHETEEETPQNDTEAKVDETVVPPIEIELATQKSEEQTSDIETAEVKEPVLETEKIIKEQINETDKVREQSKLGTEKVETEKVVKEEPSTDNVLEHPKVESNKIVEKDTEEQTPKTDSEAELDKTAAPSIEIESEALESEEQTSDIATADTELDSPRNLDSSLNDLNESLESNHTVIENKSFEANADSLRSSDEEFKDAEATTPEKVSSADTLESSNDAATTPEKDSSVDTLESSNDTIKTPERDNSKESLNTDTGYTSSVDHEKSPVADSTPEEKAYGEKTPEKSQKEVVKAADLNEEEAKVKPSE